MPCLSTSERPLTSLIIRSCLGPTKLKNFNTSHCLLKWFASYIFHQCQRVRVGSQVFYWKTLCGSMPQGSRLGPFSFIVMIDDLRANCEVHKFVDNTTLSELIPPPNSPSNMTDYLSSLLIWTADNYMQLNTSKTKEMILGRIDSTFIPPLSTPAGPIQRVNTFKLFGHLDVSLSWTTHIDTIVSKASKRLYFLKQLRRAGVPHSN